MTFTQNELRMGDNLLLLRDRSVCPDESVDMIYLDPPLQPHRGAHSSAKEVTNAPYDPVIPTRTNIWRWDDDALERYNEIIDTGSHRLRAVMGALQTMLSHSAMFAYLVHMTPRLMESQRVLKKTGSVFLHCDPIASHYLKIIMDCIFGQRALVNEIVWKRIGAHGDVAHTAHHMGRVHDIILYYRKSEKSTFHVQHVMGSDDYVDHFFPHTDFRTGKRYRLGDVTVAKQPAHGTYDLHIKRQGEEGRWMGDLEDEYRKPKPDWEYRLVPPHKGRFWGLPKDLMQKMEREGLIIYSRVGYPHVKRFMPAGGVPVQDIWVDIPPVTGTDRLYNSQKPKALLERIIATASNPGDVILDPFCGAGPTLDAVETLNRQNPEKPARVWVGMEASSLSLNLIKYRLGRFYPAAKYKLIGDIKDMRSALLFAARHPLEFQYWAFGLIGARPMGGDKARKGEERQIDGVRYFKDKNSDKLLPILVQVKNGNAKVDDVRGLDGFCRRTKAALGILISLQDPTKDAWAEAAACGTYFCQATDQGYPKIQLVTLEDLLKEGRRANLEAVQLPPRHPSEMFK